jgi:biopolymer transport protein ExbB
LLVQLFAASLLVTCLGSSIAWAQSNTVSDDTLNDLASTARQNEVAQRDDLASGTAPRPGINILALLIRGGWFMVPIALMSLVVVAMAFERFIGIRMGRVLPAKLRRGLAIQIAQPNALDVEAVHKLCNENESPGERVVRSFLSKIGRPQSEIEATVSAESQREADRLYSNVRYLTLAASVTPLLGLLGTVWGLIQAFHDTSQLAVSANRAEDLAAGIYVALVTTLAGLVVAIPAAILAHYFEGRITNIFSQLDQLLARLVSKAEPYENRTRFESTFGSLTCRDISEEVPPARASTIKKSNVHHSEAISSASSEASAHSLANPQAAATAHATAPPVHGNR